MRLEVERLPLRQLLLGQGREGRGRASSPRGGQKKPGPPGSSVQEPAGQGKFTRSAEPGVRTQVALVIPWGRGEEKGWGQVLWARLQRAGPGPLALTHPQSPDTGRSLQCLPGRCSPGRQARPTASELPCPSHRPLCLGCRGTGHGSLASLVVTEMLLAAWRLDLSDLSRGR